MAGRLRLRRSRFMDGMGRLRRIVALRYTIYLVVVLYQLVDT